MNNQKAISVLCFLFLAFLFASTTFAAQTDDQRSPIEILDTFWGKARENVYSKVRKKLFFTNANYQRLRRKAEEVKSVYEFTPILNNFLERLNVSHTRFFDNHSIDFYLFRSMFQTRSISEPKVNHIGVQFTVMGSRYVVREMLDGYPAEKAGLRRGDIILESNGKPFHPFHAFNPNDKDVNLKIARNEEILDIIVSPVKENPNLSFCKAMINSKRVIEVENNKVGYIHLWAGTHETILERFKEIVEVDFKDMDAIILDLRGGFGGAWYEYLDPFFPNRNDFFNPTFIDKDGISTISKPLNKQKKAPYFDGPMVVLINEGVRSGKEALAYQFKKSKRAVLIGTRTQGAFTGGRAIFNEEKLPFFLYLASSEILLDGNKIEGRGILPDEGISYPLQESSNVDPQLNAAIKKIARLLKEKLS
jgi:carboxyl-terminal processing protease